SLEDYQHVHPAPGRVPGEWHVRFTPRRAGTYRVFGDFTPAATARGLYAHADIEVAAAGAQRETAATLQTDGAELKAAGYRFSLTTLGPAAKAGQPMDLRFAGVHRDGGEVPLEPVMDAYAHLVAFDPERSGFAHLHPVETD